MRKRLQCDLLGLVIGALDDHEQEDLADKCRREARLSRYVAWWQRRLQALDRYWKKEREYDPPVGLAERTIAFVFLDGSLRSTPKPELSAPSKSPVSSDSYSLPEDQRAFPSAGKYQSKAATCSVRFEGQSRRAALALRVDGSGGKTSLIPKYERAHTARQWNVVLSTGAVSEAYWWRAGIVVSACLAMLAVVPPAIYQSRLQAHDLQCQHLLCWLGKTGEHLGQLHRRPWGLASKLGAHSFTSILPVDLGSFDQLGTLTAVRSVYERPSGGWATLEGNSDLMLFVATRADSCWPWRPDSPGPNFFSGGVIFLTSPNAKNMWHFVGRGPCFYGPAYPQMYKLPRVSQEWFDWEGTGGKQLAGLATGQSFARSGNLRPEIEGLSRIRGCFACVAPEKVAACELGLAGVR